MKQERIKLRNGINLLYYNLPATNSVSTCIMFKAGSVNETKEEYGAAHFLEHCMGDGSKNYPDDFKKDFQKEKFGIIENAWTDKNSTCYWMKAPIKNFDISIDMLFDMTYTPLLREKSIIKQKAIVLEEIKMEKDNPWHVAWDSLSQNIFQDSALAHLIIGTEKSVGNFSKDLINNFYERHYTPENMMVWVGGNIDFSNVCETLEKLSVPKRKSSNRIPKSGNKKRNRVVVNKMHISTNYMFLGINGFPLEKKNLEHLLIANTILGNGKGSLFCNELMVKKPLVSDCDSDLITYLEEGIFLCGFITSDKNISKTLKIATDQIKKIAYGNISKELLTRAKNLLKTSFLKLQESSEEFVFISGDLFNLPRRELLTGKEVDFYEVLEKIESATSEEVSKAFSQACKNSRIVVSISGPNPSVKEEVAKVMSKLKF